MLIDFAEQKNTDRKLICKSTNIPKQINRQTVKQINK